MVVRSATHAGSWYSGGGKDLDQELQGWLEGVPKEITEVGPEGGLCKVPVKGARAIIGPHAGFSYSGPNAAYGYQCINTENVKRVFLLGPSHHAYLEKCALSRCTEYETPLGNIQVDREIRAVMLGRRSDRPSGVPVWQSIERLDFAGIEAIEHIDHARFKQYLDETENTICGRHPIGVLLAAVNALYPAGEQGNESPRLRFVKYDQSNRVESVSGSSVSYASAYLWFPE
ncbi:hypothetical protein H4S08_001549 [Coemansia sp. RSA 1365]|nr:hypothetical protein H4S08_001549 [Coemansia sp. RSA 1365]